LKFVGHTEKPKTGTKIGLILCFEQSKIGKTTKLLDQGNGGSDRRGDMSSRYIVKKEKYIE
jgi:hypothetical protein